MSVLSDPIGEVKDGAVGPVVCCWDVDGVGPVVAFLGGLSLHLNHLIA